MTEGNCSALSHTLNLPIDLGAVLYRTIDSHTLLIVAIFSTLSGWILALYALLRVLLDTPHQDKRHPQLIFIALSLG